MTPIDVTWLLGCCALVMLMQAGFLCLETGLTRSKNSINVALKNIADLGISALLFWFMGWGFMFGESTSGLIGWSGFSQDLSSTDAGTATIFLFQTLFCGTAVAIISGAVAGRLRFGWFLALAALVTAVVYPVAGHWLWHGDGWLAKLGFFDFAGSTVVHSLGGWSALAVIVTLGPRMGRFDGDESSPLFGSNIPFAALGALLLWVGWLGFSGGSVLGFSDGAVTAVVHTALAGCAGLIGGLGIGRLNSRHYRVHDPINGLLAGLVAVTASANHVSTISALLIGAFGALAAKGVELLLVHYEIDDAVGAVPVHLGGGVWGTLAVAMFCDPQELGANTTRLGQFGVQLLGVGVTGVWAFGVVLVCCRWGNRYQRLRVDAEAERIGLNVSEHGASTDLVALLQGLESQAESEYLKSRVPEHRYSAAGQIGRQFNQVIDALEQTEASRQVSESAAQRDDLTQVLNRRGLTKLLEETMASERAILIFDVIHFGSINESIGYVAGDAVLREVASTLNSRLGDRWHFARWGGDEFVAVHEGRVEFDSAVLDGMVCRISEWHSITVSVRAGLVYLDPGVDAEEAMQRASFTLDEVKRNDTNLALFDRTLSERYERSAELSRSLAGALDSGRVVPVGQTLLEQGRAVGVELLARWRNDDWSLAPPSEFLPVFISNGMMADLDRYMIRQAAAFAAGLSARALTQWVSVNVSAPTLADPHFPNFVADTLAAHDLRAEQLVIEVTETERVANDGAWIRAAHALRELGVQLAVDDFGSGYSTIERMRDLPITHVKFDRSLVQEAAGPMSEVLQSVVDYAHAHGIVTVAEGIESAEQHSAVSALGIAVMQGFLFSVPEPLDTVVERFAEGLGDAAASLGSA